MIRRRKACSEEKRKESMYKKLRRNGTTCLEEKAATVRRFCMRVHAHMSASKATHHRPGETPHSRMWSEGERFTRIQPAVDIQLAPRKGACVEGGMGKGTDTGMVWYGMVWHGMVWYLYLICSQEVKYDIGIQQN